MMTPRPSTCRPRAAAALAAAAIAMLPPSAGATVHEAHSFSMEAAAKHVEDGFAVRGEPWTGGLARGGRKVIRHQLFRGNEYWFWLGTPTAGARLTVKIYDRKGRPVHVETIAGERWAAARVLPPKTGTYLIVVSAPEKKGGGGAAEFDWSLSYGFR